ncbi:hypothetical protein RFI_33318, partial [Reticulomyxa filosa]
KKKKKKKKKKKREKKCNDPQKWLKTLAVSEVAHARWWTKIAEKAQRGNIICNTPHSYDESCRVRMQMKVAVALLSFMIQKTRVMAQPCRPWKKKWVVSLVTTAVLATQQLNAIEVIVY